MNEMFVVLLFSVCPTVTHNGTSQKKKNALLIHSLIICQFLSD